MQSLRSVPATFSASHFSFPPFHFSRFTHVLFCPHSALSNALFGDTNFGEKVQAGKNISSQLKVHGVVQSALKTVFIHYAADCEPTKMKTQVGVCLTNPAGGNESSHTKLLTLFLFCALEVVLYSTPLCRRPPLVNSFVPLPSLKSVWI